MMATSPLYDHHPESDAVARHGLSDTVRKVDRAVARLEELQCLVRASHCGNPPCLRQNDPQRREKVALHARTAHHRSGSLNRTLTNATERTTRLQQREPARNGKPSSHAETTSRGRAAPLTIPSPPLEVSNSSPPSSACSSSVPAVSMRRRVPLMKEMPPSKLPRTFIVDTGRPTNPNRPWCLSVSPSPATSSSTATSNYVYTPSSNSSSAAVLPMKSPSRFSPLHRQSSRSHRAHESYQSQPLLCRSPEGLVARSTIKGSPNPPRKSPWFSQNRLSLPTLNVSALNTKKARCRFSLASNAYRDSPPRPLPTLITRLPKRRNNPFLPVEKAVGRSLATAKSTPSGSPQKGQAAVRRQTPEATATILQQGPTSTVVPPLPLPPALQGQVGTTNGFPSALPSSDKKKVIHKRSSSCFLPLTEGIPNIFSNPVESSQLSTRKGAKGACFHGANKENCFPGCSPVAWPCLRRSWSFRQQPTSENFMGSGPSILSEVKSYVQHGKNSRMCMYKVDSFEQEANAAGGDAKLYMG